MKFHRSIKKPVAAILVSVLVLSFLLAAAVLTPEPVVAGGCPPCGHCHGFSYSQSGWYKIGCCNFFYELQKKTHYQWCHYGWDWDVTCTTGTCLYSSWSEYRCAFSGICGTW